LTSAVVYERFWLAVMLRLVLVLALFALLPIQFGGPDPCAHRDAAAALVGVGQTIPDPSVDLWDMDQDDSPPADSGAAQDGPDEALVTATSPLAARRETPLDPSPPEGRALGPARGHARGTEYPPEVLLVRRES
jgi:hypothetical protein